MRVSAAPLVLLLAVGACAPSADLRIDTPAGPLAPGRLVVVPVETRGKSVQVEGETLDKAAFESADDHGPAFWSAFASALNDALPAVEVRLGEPTSGAMFGARRALVRGAKSGYGQERWTVETLSLPDTVAYGDLGADYVLFVADAFVSSARPQLMASPLTGYVMSGRSISAAGRMVLFQDGRDAPLLSHTLTGSQGGGGIAKVRLSRETWEEAVADLARRLAAASGGR